MNRSDIKPRYLSYYWVLLIFILGMVISTALLVHNLYDAIKIIQRVVVPGKIEISIEDIGDYTIYQEIRSEVDRKIYISDKTDITGLKCKLTNKTTGEEIQITQSKNNSSYSYGGKEGHSLLDFVINKPGTYEFSAGYERDKDGFDTVLAVGKYPGVKIFNILVSYVIEIVVITGISTGLALFIYFRKQRYKKA